MPSLAVMSMKNWPHRPGTCRALARGMGPQIVACHPCRRYIAMPKLEVPFYPCPFVCGRCGTRGEIMDASDPPAGYERQERLTGPPPAR